LADQPIHNPKDFSEVLRLLESTDPAHASTFNPLFETLINNDAFIKAYADALAGAGRTTETIKGNADAHAAHLADFVRQPGYANATGSANTYAVTLTPAPTAYTEGMAIAVKINADNTGASTINVNSLGAKSIKKANGNDVSVGNLKTGSIYTLRYNGTNFILQGSDAAGNAIPADVLSGKTFTNDAGDQTGTMTNKVGSATVITPGTADQTIPQGYYGGATGDGKVLGDSDLVASNIKNGVDIFGVTGSFPNDGTAGTGDVLSGKTFYNSSATKQTGTMTNRGAYNITPGASNVTIPAGYHNGAGVVYGDSDLVASNIKNGVDIFGVTGSFTGFKSVQYVTIALANLETSKTATITSVDITKSVIIFLGQTTVSTDSNNLSDYMARIELTNATTVTAYRTNDNDDVTISCVVIEFDSAVINSKQSGTILISAGNTSNTATITAVNIAKSLLLYCGVITSYTGTVPIHAFSRLALTNSTTITATRGNSSNSATVGWNLIEFK